MAEDFALVLQRPQPRGLIQPGRGEGGLRAGQQGQLLFGVVGRLPWHRLRLGKTSLGQG